MATVDGTQARDVGDVSYDGFISYSHAADDLLAPRLQAGLQRFAKPWWKRRAVRIFRDESSLSANPHLWSSITQALDGSEWFVLLLSPDAARSEWVNQEISYWVANRDPRRILPVVTDGTFGWADGDVTGDAVPDTLRCVFSEEPRWVDVRWAKGEDQLDLQDPRFADAVADIASTIRGIPKDELASEEVRQHRRTVRTAWAAGGLVMVLAVAAVGFGVQSTRNADEAERQAERAEQNADQARVNAEEADAQRQAAEDAQEDALVAANLARSRELAAASINLLDDDTELSLVLALSAIDVAGSGRPPVESIVALREATSTMRIISRFEIPGAERAHAGALSPDGQTFVWLSADSVSAAAFDTTTFEMLWSWTDPDSPDFADLVYFGNDGSEVVFAVADSSSQGFAGTARDLPADDNWARIVVLDAESGELERQLEGPPACPGLLLGPQSPATGLWPVLMSDDPACEFSEDWRIDLVDLETLDAVESFDARSPSSMSWSGDGRRLSVSSYFGRGAMVHDMDTGELVLDAPDRFFGQLGPDGAVLAASAFSLSNQVELYDLDSGLVIDNLIGLDDTAFDIEFTDDGRVIAGSRTGNVVSWIAEGGAVDFALPSVGATIWAAFDPSTGRYYHLSETTLTVIDASSSGSLGDTGDLGGFVYSNAIVEQGDFGAVLLVDPSTGSWSVAPLDPRSGSIESERLEVHFYNAVLGDGRIITEAADRTGDEATRGPVVVWDPATGDITRLVGCRIREADLIPITSGVSDGACVDEAQEYFEPESIRYDGSSNTLLIASTSGEVLLFDGTDLELLDEFAIAPGRGVAGFGAGWLAVSSNPGGVVSLNEEVTLHSLPSLEEIAVVAGFQEETDPSGRLLALHDRPGGFTVYEPTTGAVIATGEAGNGRIRGMAFSPDSSKLMTAGTDGFVRIWDLDSSREVDRFPIDEASDGHWIDEQTLVVSTRRGEMIEVSLDLQDAYREARARLIRAPTEIECAAYRLDPCPSLEELQGG